MPNYRRAFVPGGCWFFTVNLFDRKNRLLVEHIGALREAVRETRRRARDLAADVGWVSAATAAEIVRHDDPRVTQHLRAPTVGLRAPALTQPTSGRSMTQEQWAEKYSENSEFIWTTVNKLPEVFRRYMYFGDYKRD